MHNEGYDNEDYDYILYVNDWLGNDQNKYVDYQFTIQLDHSLTGRTDT